MTQWRLPLSLDLIDKRQIRSFVTRQGRLTKGQRLALEESWQDFGVELNAIDSLIAQFSDYDAVVLEIGFGNGQSLAQMAQAAPNTLFIGVEVHQPGVGALLQQLRERTLSNVRICYADARDVLQALPIQSLDRVQIFFPDPWPKKRHHKRRILQPEFVMKIVERLKAGAAVHCATDWLPYAEFMLETLSASPTLVNQQPLNQPFGTRPTYRPPTKFERRGEKLGHGVYDLIFHRK